MGDTHVDLRWQNGRLQGLELLFVSSSGTIRISSYRYKAMKGVGVIKGPPREPEKKPPSIAASSGVKEAAQLRRSGCYSAIPKGGGGGGVVVDG
jgi:hypothetical protein